jgi:hypothetical protein
MRSVRDVALRDEVALLLLSLRNGREEGRLCARASARSRFGWGYRPCRMYAQNPGASWFLPASASRVLHTPPYRKRKSRNSVKRFSSVSISFWVGVTTAAEYRIRPVGRARTL